MRLAASRALLLAVALCVVAALGGVDAAIDPVKPGKVKDIDYQEQEANVDSEYFENIENGQALFDGPTITGPVPFVGDVTTWVCGKCRFPKNAKTYPPIQGKNSLLLGGTGAYVEANSFANGIKVLTFAIRRSKGTPGALRVMLYKQRNQDEPDKTLEGFSTGSGLQKGKLQTFKIVMKDVFKIVSTDPEKHIMVKKIRFESAAARNIVIDSIRWSTVFLEGSCSSFTCPVHKPNAEAIKCVNGVCLHSTCCDESAKSACNFQARRKCAGLFRLPCDPEKTLLSTCGACVAGYDLIDKKCKRNEDVQRTCDEFQCDAKYSLKADPEAIKCDGLCDQSTCCIQNAMCTASKCSDATWTPKENIAQISCSTESCSRSECCDQKPISKKCTFSWTCKDANYARVDRPWNVKCTGEDGACTDDDCCAKRSSCDEYACPAKRYHKKPYPDGVKNVLCRRDICSRYECCEENETCRGKKWFKLKTGEKAVPFKCPAGEKEQLNMVVACDQSPCESRQCCIGRQKCSDYTCPKVPAGDEDKPDRLQADPDKAGFICAKTSCTVGECCKGMMKCAEYTCDPFTSKKKLQDLPGDCGKSQCVNSDCCKKNDTCPSDFKCTASKSKSWPKPEDITCAGSKCLVNECCNQFAMCNEKDSSAPLVNGRRPYKMQCDPDTQILIAGNMCSTTTNEKTGRFECSTSDCCVQRPTCAGFPCTTGKTLNANPSAIKCKRSRCFSSECCSRGVSKPSCKGFTCEKGFKLKRDPQHACDNTGADGKCLASECCVELSVTLPGRCWKLQSCGKGKTKAPGSYKIKCETETCRPDECCTDVQKCSDYNCPVKLWHPKVFDDVIVDGKVTNPKLCRNIKCRARECCDQNQKCGDLKCQTGVQSAKPNSAGTICQAKMCTTGECCTKAASCFSQKCPDGETPKLNHNTIKCKTATCTNEECCDGVQRCKEYTCSPGWNINWKKRNRHMCLSQTCTDSECCVKNPTCALSSALCTASKGWKRKADYLTRQCAGRVCKKNDCCDAPGTCDTYTCKEGTSLRDDADTINCSTTQCSNDECCRNNNGACMDMDTCPDGHWWKSDWWKVECATADCTASECCSASPKCNTFACPIRYKRKPKYDDIVCRFSDCYRSDCCVANQRCADYKCPTEEKQIDPAPWRPCEQELCRPDECCVGTQNCSSFTCAEPDMKPKAAKPDTINCKGTSCTMGECCVGHEKCKDLVCPVGWSNKAGQAEFECAGGLCVREECCDRNPTCLSYACPVGHSALREESLMGTITCMEPECKMNDCCQPNETCDKWSNNNDCPTNADRKPMASAIICNKSKCEVGECCLEPKGKCHGITCTAGKVLKTQWWSFKCATDPCTTDECCQAASTCKGYVCPLTEYHPKKAKDGGVPSCSFATCYRFDCCEPNQRCSDYQCPETISTPMTWEHPNFNYLCPKEKCEPADCCEGHQKCGEWAKTVGGGCPATHRQKDRSHWKDGDGSDTATTHQIDDFDNKICATLKCEVKECCVGKEECHDYHCPAKSSYRSDSHLVLCAGPQCLVSECCEDNHSCANHVCESGWSARPHQETIICSQHTKCADSECCDANQMCSQHTCNAGYVLKTNAAVTQCNKAYCSQHECCEYKKLSDRCAGVTCDDGQIKKKGSWKIECSQSPCKTSDCCTAAPFCGSYSCPAQYHPKSNMRRLACGSSTCYSWDCCDRNQRCNEHHCPTGEVLKNDVLWTKCKGAKCTNNECCDSQITCGAWRLASSGCRSLKFDNTKKDVKCRKADCLISECCKGHDVCGNHSCIRGTTNKPNNAKTKCTDEMCTNCCKANPTCKGDKIKCPSKTWIKFPDFDKRVCGHSKCELSDCCLQRDTCRSFGESWQRWSQPNLRRCTEPISGSKIVREIDVNKRDNICKGGSCEVKECCKIKRGRCSAFWCGNFEPKADKKTRLCRRDKCDHTQCCLPSENCNTYSCQATDDTKVNKDNASNISCEGRCSTRICCERKDNCGSYSCQAAGEATGLLFTKRPGYDKVLCKGATCKPEECCFGHELCSQHTCKDGTARNPAVPLSFACATPACENSECCTGRDSCSSWHQDDCDSGFHLRDAYQVIQCTGPKCEMKECCYTNPSCSSYTCWGKSHRKWRPAKVCTGKWCTQFECCDSNPKCGDSKYVCSLSGYKRKDGTFENVCDGSRCTRAECCVPEDKPTCKTFDCTSNSNGLFRQRDKSEDIACGSDGCSTGTCCDSALTCKSFPCKPGREVIDPKATCSGEICSEESCCQDKTTCGRWTCNEANNWVPREHMEEVLYPRGDDVAINEICCTRADLKYEFPCTRFYENNECPKHYKKAEAGKLCGGVRKQTCNYSSCCVKKSEHMISEHMGIGVLVGIFVAAAVIVIGYFVFTRFMAGAGPAKAYVSGGGSASPAAKESKATREARSGTAELQEYGFVRMES